MNTSQFDSKPDEVDHWTPESHWCAGCWHWVVDCEHVLDPLPTEHYDRCRVPKQPSGHLNYIANKNVINRYIYLDPNVGSTSQQHQSTRVCGEASPAALCWPLSAGDMATWPLANPVSGFGIECSNPVQSIAGRKDVTRELEDHSK